MVIKRKKNCKIIYEEKNSKYYVDKVKSLQSFDTLKDAFMAYGEIHKQEKEIEGRYYRENRLIYKLHPNDVFLISQALEIYKFFIDKSMFFNCDKEDLQSKSLDIFYLYQILYKQYLEYVPKEIQEKIEKENQKIKLRIL